MYLRAFRSGGGRRRLPTSSSCLPPASTSSSCHRHHLPSSSVPLPLLHLRRCFLTSTATIPRAYQHKHQRLLVLSRLFSSSSPHPDPRTIGIVREAFGKWERRTPLAPSHVQALTQQGIKVLVQPSFRRVYPDEAYTASGATVQEDLSPASVILGVKQVPISALLPRRTYLMFAHVLKGQPENMPLLDAIRSQRIRLVDYECITATGERGGPRLVYFGRFAGVAGMVDILQGVGQNLLARGYNTPFLWSPFTYMYRDLEGAKEGVRRLGEAIASEGLPREVCPLVVAFTGRGKVAKGAQEMFELLPHEWLEIGDLPKLVASFRGEGGREGGAGGAMAAAQRKVYGVRVKEEDMVARVWAGEDDDHRGSSSFSSSSPSSHPTYNRAEYRTHPERYRPIFHERVAPYISVLINGMYWDGKFPRLLSKAQVKGLWGKEGGKEGGKCRLLAVADVSCDVEGSCEFLTRTTEIERPFFNYLPESGESLEKIDGRGIVVGGVDILPAELPREASLAFGDALIPLLPHLLQGEGGEGGREGQLPPPLEGAMITTWEGELSEAFKYIDFLRVEHARAEQLFERIHGPRRAAKQPPSLASSLLPSQQREGEVDLPHVTLSLRGHLFDSGLINQILDVVEARGGAFVIAQCEVRPNKGKGEGMEKHFSTVLLEVEAPTEEGLRDIVKRVQKLAELVEAAEASVTEMSYESPSSSVITPTSSSSSPTTSPSLPPSAATATVHSPQRVLVLGAGRVSGPAIDYLSQRHEVLVVGATAEEITRLGQRDTSSSKGSHRGVVLDVQNESAALRKLMDKSDIVLSLLPAPMHPLIARDCLSLDKPLITTSYISEDLRKMHKAATAQGLVFLNEVGLDPGMDHASAMRIINQAKAEGGEIVSFRSVCGGLPSPDAAGKTPFLYKFSWSPRAVLTAAENSATYLEGGKIVRVEGEELLRHAHPCPPQAFPTMRLEVLPNRNALLYQELYGIQEAETCFRGTLRYEGWSEIMYGCKVLGLLSHEILPSGCGSWQEYLAHVLVGGGGEGGREEEAWRKLVAAGVQDPGRVLGALGWLGLGMRGGASLSLKGGGVSVIDAFSALLEEKLKYGPGEVDMVAMRHDIIVAHGGGMGEEEHHHHHTSSLLVYGNERDSAMALTVGKTAAVATDLVLQGELQKAKILGVLAPTLPAIYLPLLDRLAEEGLVFEEQCQVVVPEKKEKQKQKDEGREDVFLE